MKKYIFGILAVIGGCLTLCGLKLFNIDVVAGKPVVTAADSDLEQIYIDEGGSYELNGGTVWGDITNTGGTVSMAGGTVYGLLMNKGGTFSMTGGVVNATVANDGGTCTISSSVRTFKQGRNATTTINGGLIASLEGLDGGDYDSRIYQNGGTITSFSIGYGEYTYKGGTVTNTISSYHGKIIFAGVPSSKIKISSFDSVNGSDGTVLATLNGISQFDLSLVEFTGLRDGYTIKYDTSGGVTRIVMASVNVTVTLSSVYPGSYFKSGGQTISSVSVPVGSTVSIYTAANRLIFGHNGTQLYIVEYIEPEDNARYIFSFDYFYIGGAKLTSSFSIVGDITLEAICSTSTRKITITIKGDSRCTVNLSTVTTTGADYFTVSANTITFYNGEKVTATPISSQFLFAGWTYDDYSSSYLSGANTMYNVEYYKSDNTATITAHGILKSFAQESDDGGPGVGDWTLDTTYKLSGVSYGAPRRQEADAFITNDFAPSEDEQARDWELELAGKRRLNQKQYAMISRQSYAPLRSKKSLA